MLHRCSGQFADHRALIEDRTYGLDQSALCFRHHLQWECPDPRDISVGVDAGINDATAKVEWKALRLPGQETLTVRTSKRSDELLLAGSQLRDCGSSLTAFRGGAVTISP
jgi:hypothetical protein